MRFCIGTYAYFTKITLLELKEKLDMPFEYVRDDYDHLVLHPAPGTTVKVTQDGLIYIDSAGQLEDIERWIAWLKDFLKSIVPLDHEDFFYNIIKEKPPAIIILPDKAVKTEEVYKSLKRSFDYRIKSPKVVKEYGDGCVLFRDVRLPKHDLDDLIEHQMILADYQNLVKLLLAHNKRYWHRISQVREQNKYIFKDLPELIDELLDMRRHIDAILHRIRQLDDTLMSRESRCGIRHILKGLKLDDYGEMVRLNNYVHDQFEMTRDYISSTVELIQFIYSENEQKELNLLQVIFAIGTIASLISLAGISDDQFIVPTADGNVVGELLTFDMQSMLLWTGISIAAGVVLFIILNYIFLHAKKLRLVSLTKKR